MTSVSVRPLSLAVFVGTRGRGSNLFALHDAIQQGRLAAKIVAVVGTRGDAPVIERARDAGLPVLIVDPKPLGDDYESALLSALKDAGADTIALAGFPAPRAVPHHSGVPLGAHRQYPPVPVCRCSGAKECTANTSTGRLSSMASR